MTVNILIVDDHQIVRDGLSALLESAKGFEVTAKAENGQEAIKIIGTLKIDIVLMDIDMPEMNGIEATEFIVKNAPNVKVIVLTMYDEKSIIEKMIGLGAAGYLLKNSSRDELVLALETVAAGNQYFSDHVNSVMLKKDSGQTHNILLSGLTDREMEIFRYIAEGFSNKEIGEKLFISHRTVDTHRNNLMQKLEVRNIAGLVRLAIKSGLVA